jgi:hypothetical protein
MKTKVLRIFAILFLIVVFATCKSEPEMFRYVTSNPHGGLWQETNLPILYKDHKGIELVEINLDDRLNQYIGLDSCLRNATRASFADDELKMDWDAAENTWASIGDCLFNDAQERGEEAFMISEDILHQWESEQERMISISEEKPEPHYNPVYYLYRHITDFVTGGAEVLDHPADFEEIMLFLNPGNELSGILLNTGFEPRSVQLKIGEKYLIIQLMPKSFNSFSVEL